MKCAIAVCCLALSAYCDEVSFGVAAHLTDHEFDTRERALEMMRQAGLSSVRTDFPWDRIQPSPDAPFDFSRYDQVVADAERVGVEVVPLVGFPPKWALPVADHLPEWRRFVKEVLKRYRGRIFAVEVWNEENHPGFWPNPNPVDFAPVMRAAFESARETDPSVRVVLGGLAGVDISYIRALYNEGCKPYFDVMAVHPYTWPEPPEGSLDVQLMALRKLMAEFGDGDKPIWITEIGWPTQKATLPLHNLFLAGLKAARPTQEAWRIGYVDICEDEAKGADLAEQMQSILPQGSTARAYSVRELPSRLGELDAVVFPYGEAGHLDLIEPVAQFVKNGGVLVDFGGCPLWFTYKGGRHVEKSPSGRAWRELAWEAFRVNVIWPNAKNGLDRKAKTLATAAATAAGLKFEPNGFACFRFFDGARLKPGDRFIPLTTAKGKNGREYAGAALYQFDSDYKGAVVVVGNCVEKGCTTESEQARYLVATVDIARRLGIERTFFYEFQSNEKDPFYSEDHFGMVHRDLAPKPGYLALKEKLGGK